MNIDDVIAHWEAGPLEQGAGTAKIFYRSIGGFEFQFRKIGYEQRTGLALRCMTVMKHAIPAYKMIPMLAADLDPDDPDIDAKIGIMILPEIIAALSTPSLHEVITELCETASVKDKTTSIFVSLTDKIMGEKVFGDDITLQIPVALTAATINIDTVIKAGDALL
jgi:hypothetical protein